jgi:hypothetical protein
VSGNRLDLQQRSFVGPDGLRLGELLLFWRRLQRARWITRGQPTPSCVFPSLEVTALEERNVRHMFTRLLR